MMKLVMSNTMKIKSIYENINTAFGGELVSGRTYVIGGYVGHGKTSLTSQIVAEAAGQLEDRNILVLSGQEGRAAFCSRINIVESLVGSSKIMGGVSIEDSFLSLHGLSVEDLVDEMAWLCDQSWGLICVDGLERLPLINGLSRSETMNVYLNLFADIAIGNDIIVLITATLPRQRYETPDSIYSYDPDVLIPEIADVCVNVYRDDVQHGDDSTDPGSIYMFNVKNRYGPSSFRTEGTFIGSVGMIGPVELKEAGEAIDF